MYVYHNVCVRGCVYACLFVRPSETQLLQIKVTKIVNNTLSGIAYISQGLLNAGLVSKYYVW